MKKYLILAFLSVALCCQGQGIKRGHWSLTPVMKSSLFGPTVIFGLLNNLCNPGETLMYDTGNMQIRYPLRNWHKPRIRYMLPLNSVGSPDGASISRPFWWRNLLLGDYSHTFKISAGYEVAWKSTVSPWNVFGGAEWEYNHLRLDGGDEAGAHYSQAVIPYAGIRYRIGGGKLQKAWMPTFELTGAYVNNFKYHSEHHYDKSALGNGFRGSIGAGVYFTEMFYAIIRYEHDFFDHFNKNFTPDNGATRPFENYNTRFGGLSLSIQVDY